MSGSADEGSMYDNLIASERIGDWMSAIMQGSSIRQLIALKQLRKSLKTQAYVDEAVRLGVISNLTQLFKSSDNETATQLAAEVITACSGAAAAPPQVSQFDCGNGASVSIAEGSLSDGLGVRVWLAAHALARTLLAAPQIVQGCTVAEFGAGPGLVGLVAAHLRASQVFLTDSEDAVLQCLRTSVAATTAHETAVGLSVCSQQSSDDVVTGSSGASNGALNGCNDSADRRASMTKGSVDQSVQIGDAHWASKDVGSCSVDTDGNDGFGDGGPNAGRNCTSTAHPANAAGWQQGNIYVRRLDWRQVLPSKSSIQEHGHADADICDCPTLDEDLRFKVILASDVIYEAEGAAALAAALAHHMEQNGRALLCCPVRDQALFDLFLRHVHECGLTAELQPVRPLESDFAVASQARDYEGGFQMVAVQHKAADKFDWPWREALSWQGTNGNEA